MTFRQTGSSPSVDVPPYRLVHKTVLLAGQAAEHKRQRVRTHRVLIADPAQSAEITISLVQLADDLHISTSQLGQGLSWYGSD